MTSIKLEIIANTLTFCKNLASLLLRNALNLLQYPTWRVGDRLDSVEATIDDQLNVTLRKSTNTLQIFY